MNSFRYLSLLIFALAFVNISSAYSMDSINALLLGYNVPGSLVNSLLPSNVTYSNLSYVILYNGDNLAFVVNVSSTAPVIVTNAALIFNIIKPNVLQDTINNANYASVMSNLRKYQQSSQASISDCLVETGLDRGITCTAANLCQACQIVPNCDKVLYNAGGPTGVFATGIAAFGASYTIVNNSFNSIYSLINGLNATNHATSRPIIITAFNNVSGITRLIYQNPIFPPTANITNNQFQACSSYVGGGAQSSNVPANNAPWYCNALGYCQFTSYNYTLLNQIQAQLNAINLLAATDPQIMSIATSTSNSELSYIAPVVGAQKSAQLNAILNTTLLNYPTVVSDTQLLLSHVSNATLSSQLSSMQSLYNTMLQNYLTANLTNSTLKILDAMGRLENNYTRLNDSYSVLASKTFNATSLIVKSQLNLRAYNPALPSVAYTQLFYHAAINGQITNTSLVSNQLNTSLLASQNVYSESLPLFSLTELSRAFDAPFVLLVAPMLGLPYSGVLALSPSLSALFALILGILLFVIAYVFHHSLRRSKKLLETTNTRKAWRALFALLGVIVLIFVGFTYMYATTANGFAPSTSFVSAIHSAGSVAIIINGTSTQGEINCQTQLSSAITAMQKSPVMVSMANNECIIGNSTAKTLGACMNSFAQAGTPMIILTNARVGDLDIYSFYGTIMTVEGNDTFMSACYPQYILK